MLGMLCMLGSAMYLICRVSRVSMVRAVDGKDAGAWITDVDDSDDDVMVTAMVVVAVMVSAP